MNDERTHIHPWLQQIGLSYIPGPDSPLLDRFAGRLLDTFRQLGHRLYETPGPQTDLIVTTASFDQAVNWRKALLFTARRRFNLQEMPTILTLVHVRPAEFQHMLAHFERALAKDPIDPVDFSFPDLAPSAYQTLVEQGQRGGPILSLERLLQARTKSIRILLLVGEATPETAYLIDLVGAHPCIPADESQDFYEQVALRIVTMLSTGEITRHQVSGEPIPCDLWMELSTPAAMSAAARELGRRNFFTRMVRVADLVYVPAVHDAISSQYSEGCFATWEPRLPALIATITGSARPVDKDNVGEDELAVIVGVRPDGQGALVRQVQGKRNDMPSTEAVEMMALDGPLPQVEVPLDHRGRVSVPVVRSKLHGHRGVVAYHPGQVEYTPLDPAYYHYPVSCGTAAQARGICDAFARSQALNDPLDPRQVVFTVLPGHGLVLVEKWKMDKAPFQLIWECMDAGALVISSQVPQGPLVYTPGPDGLRHLQLLEYSLPGDLPHALDLR